MAERPILFSGPMVRAILEGRKTQTRRAVKPQPVSYGTLSEAAYHSDLADNPWMPVGGVNREEWPCPYGSPGDTLWVRETLGVTWQGDCEYMADRKEISDPRAHALCERYGDRYHFSEVRKVPSIFMPRWASRLTLRIKSVRVERLQDISQNDAQAEGLVGPMVDRELDAIVNQIGLTPRDAFRALWDSINADSAPWSSNPWVWVVEFERVKVSHG